MPVVSAASSRPVAAVRDRPRRAFPQPPGVPEWLAWALALVAALTCALVVFVPGVLRGNAVMNGSARGTALVMLVVAVPCLVAGLVGTRNGSVRAIASRLGAVAYLRYNAVQLLFATPFDRLFLLYAVTDALALWSLVA